MPKLIALVDKLPYGKFDHRKGDEFEADDRFANLVIAIGKARLAEPAPNASDLPREVMSRASKREPVTEVEVPAWKREPAPVAVEEVAEVEEEPVATKVLKAEEAVEEDEAPKSLWESSSYKRRDMVAEAPKAKPVAPPVSKPPLQQPKKRGRPSGKKS